MSQDRNNQFEPFGGLPVPVVCAEDTGWQARFLSTPLLQRLTPVHWQRLLQGMSLEDVAAGETLIEAGSAGVACFVLRSGRACVHLGGRSLAVLEPGVLFGEDALISGGCRNASVTFMVDGSGGRLPAARFEQWLLNAVIRPLGELGGRLPVSIAPAPPAKPDRLHLPLGRIRDPGIALPRARAYALVGGELRQRWLAAFVLAQQGYDALPLDRPVPGG